MLPQIFPRFPEQPGPRRLPGLDAVKDFSERAVEELAPRKHQKRPNRSVHSSAQVAGWFIVAEGVRSGKSNVLRSGPIVGLSEGLRTKAGRRRNATRTFVLIPNDSMRERLAYLRAPPSLRGTCRSSPTQAAAR